MEVALNVLVLMRSAPASMNSRWMSPMTFGLVMTSRSLQPLRSRDQSAKRSPRYAASFSLCCWIMVPMAPSSTTMRWENKSRSAWARSTWVFAVISGTRQFAFIARPHTERVADRVGQLRAVQRVDLLDGDGRRNQLARLGVVLEAVEAMLQPIGDRGAAALGEFRDLREARDRQDARHDRRVDAARRATIAEAQEHVGVIEELRDRARGARVDLALEIAQVGLEARRLRMFLRVGSHGDFEVA